MQFASLIRRSVIACFALGLASASAQPNPSPVVAERTLEQRIKAAVTRFAAQTKVPGIAFGVIAEGEVVMRAAVGSTGPPGRGSRPADVGTMFHLASLSKPFVATAIMILTEQRKVALDDPVTKHLPYFRLADDSFRLITIRQLLTHVSGLPDVDDYGWARPEYDVGALERYVKSLAAVNLKSAPGEKYSYSNIGYEILGDVIAKASGGTFEEFVATTIFRPLEMTSSTFLLAAVPPDRLTVPSVRSKEGLYVPAKYFPYHRAHAPSSTLYSNVADMLRWLRANIKEGELEGRRMLGVKAVRQMLSDGVERALPPNTPMRSIQHLGWSTLVLEGISVHGHGGHDTGFRSMMVFAPQARAGVVVMTIGDAEDVKVDSLGLHLLGMAVGKDWSSF